MKMDQYTKKISNALIEKGVYLSNSNYLKKQQLIDKSIIDNKMEDYNEHLIDLLEISKAPKSSTAPVYFLGIIIVFFVDFRSLLIPYIIGWMLIILAIIMSWFNSEGKKINAIIDEFKQKNLASFSGLEKDIKDVIKSEKTEIRLNPFILYQSQDGLLKYIENLKKEIK